MRVRVPIKAGSQSADAVMASLAVGDKGQVGQLHGVVSDVRWSADLSSEYPEWPAEPGVVVTMDVHEVACP